MVRAHTHSAAAARSHTRTPPHPHHRHRSATDLRFPVSLPGEALQHGQPRVTRHRVQRAETLLAGQRPHHTQPTGEAPTLSSHAHTRRGTRRHSRAHACDHITLLPCRHSHVPPHHRTPASPRPQRKRHGAYLYRVLPYPTSPPRPSMRAGNRTAHAARLKPLAHESGLLRMHVARRHGPQAHARQ